MAGAKPCKGLLLFPGLPSHRPAENEEAAPSYQEEEPVVERHVCREIPHVVNSEDLVVDDPFHQVEPAPTQHEQSGERSRAWQRTSSPRVGKEPVQANQREEPRRGVKESVPPHVLLHCFEGGWG